jgi:antitoxin FitA
MKVAVELSETQLEKLQQEAGRLGVLPEQLAGAAVSDLLRAPDREFQRIVGHILRKNEELYRRLS